MRILLIEDDPTTARSIELMLNHANFNVYLTDMGEEGVDLEVGQRKGQMAQVHPRHRPGRCQRRWPCRPAAA